MQRGLRARATASHVSPACLAPSFHSDIISCTRHQRSFLVFISSTMVLSMSELSMSEIGISIPFLHDNWYSSTRLGKATNSGHSFVFVMAFIYSIRIMGFIRIAVSSYYTDWLCYQLPTHYIISRARDFMVQSGVANCSVEMHLIIPDLPSISSFELLIHNRHFWKL
jgi:hypothetical protein